MHNSFCLFEGLFISHGNYSVLQNLFLERMHIFHVGEEAEETSQVYGLLCLEKCLILLISLVHSSRGSSHLIGNTFVRLP